jgi:tetratricopeptide (TPR) repeat protein
MNSIPKTIKPTRTRTVITSVLILFYLFLILFALVAATEPSWLKNFSQIGRADESRVMKDNGDSYLYQKNYLKAIVYYQRALEIKPDYTGALLNIAIAYNYSGNSEQGLKILQAAIGSNPRQAGTIYYNIAEVLKGQGKKQEAIEYYLKAVDSEIRQELIYCNLGVLYFETSDLENALGAFLRALEIQTDPTTPYFNMIKIQKAFSEISDVDLAALKEIEERGVKVEDLKDYDIKTIESINGSDPEIAKTRNFLGLIYAKQGNFAEAQRQFELAMQIWPGNDDARNNLRALKGEKK